MYVHLKMPAPQPVQYMSIFSQKLKKMVTMKKISMTVWSLTIQHYSQKTLKYGCVLPNYALSSTPKSGG